MKLNRKLRPIHMATALFSLPFLLAYVTGAVEFAHRKWLPLSVHTTVVSRKLAPGISDARILARQWRGELSSVTNSPGILNFVVTSPLGRSYSVSYSIATGGATIKTSESFLRSLAFMHVSHGIWAATAALVSLALLTLGVTGICLWFKNRSSRLMGVILLLLGPAMVIGLIVSMRWQ